jgi:hypothetical protein
MRDASGCWWKQGLTRTRNVSTRLSGDSNDCCQDRGHQGHPQGLIGLNCNFCLKVSRLRVSLYYDQLQGMCRREGLMQLMNGPHSSSKMKEREESLRRNDEFTRVIIVAVIFTLGVIVAATMAAAILGGHISSLGPSLGHDLGGHLEAGLRNLGSGVASDKATQMLANCPSPPRINKMIM